jgi:hypothetical protein
MTVFFQPVHLPCAVPACGPKDDVHEMVRLRAAGGRQFSVSQSPGFGKQTGGRISLFGQGTLIFSSARSEIFVVQPDPIENELRRSAIFRKIAKQMSPLRGFAF